MNCKWNYGYYLYYQWQVKDTIGASGNYGYYLYYQWQVKDTIGASGNYGWLESQPHSQI